MKKENVLNGAVLSRIILDHSNHFCVSWSRYLIMYFLFTKIPSAPKTGDFWWSVHVSIAVTDPGIQISRFHPSSDPSMPTETKTSTRVPSAMEVAMRSSVSFGRVKTNYKSSVQDVYQSISRTQLRAAKGGSREDVLQMVRGTHFVLGDNVTNYSTTNQMKQQNGKRGDSKDGLQYGDLLVSNLSLGQEKTNYNTSVNSQYKTFGADDMARPSRDIAIKLMAGSQLKLGDEELTYKSESKSRFVPESSLMAVKVEQKKEKDPLAQNGRAAPLSSVCLGRYNEQWASGSIGAAPNPINHKEYTPYEGRASTKVDAYKSNMILGDEVLDYRSCKIPPFDFVYYHHCYYYNY